MSRKRTTIRPEDLLNGEKIIHPSGKVLTLGPPKKINVNMNVVNHCQLFGPRGKVFSAGEWWNMTNLRDHGFKLYQK